MADFAELAISVETSALKRALDEIDKFARAAGVAEGSADNFGKKAEEGFDRVEKGSKKASAGVDVMSISFKQAKDIIAGFTGTLTAAFLVEKAITSSRALGAALAEVSTLLSDSAAQMGGLETEARSMAQTFGTTALAQTKAFYQALSAGAGTVENAAAVIDAANRLAIGGVTDVTTAVDILTTATNVYKEQGLTAAQASDALFVAMKAGKTTITELSASLGKVLPIASSLGISFDEVTSATAALTLGGIATAESVTGLRAAMSAVLGPSSEAEKLAKKLGIEFNTAGLQAKGFAGFMADIVQKTGGSSEAMQTLFSSVEATTVALALSGSAGKSLGAILEATANKAGATAEAYEKMAASFDQRLNRALAAGAEALLVLGDALLKVVVPAIEASVAAMRFLSENATTLGAILLPLAATQIPALVVGLVGIAARGAAAAASMILLATQAGIATTAITGLSAAMAAFGGPVGIVLGLITAAGVGLYMMSQRSDEATVATQGLDEAIKLSSGTVAGANIEDDKRIESLRKAGQAALKAAQAELGLAEARVLAARKDAQVGGASGANFGGSYVTKNAVRDVERASDQIANLSAKLKELGTTSRATAPAVTPTTKAVVDLGDKSDDAAKKLQAAIKTAKDYAAGLRLDAANMSRTAQEIKAVEVAAAAAAAPTKALAQEIRDAGRAWQLAFASKEVTADAIKAFKDLGDAATAAIGATAQAQVTKDLDERNRAFEAGQAALKGYTEAMQDLAAAGDIDLGATFGKAGEAIDSMVDSMKRLAFAQNAYDQARTAAGENVGKIKAAELGYDRAKIAATGQMLNSAKKLFSEQSAGYRAIQAAEKAMAALNAINTVKSVAAGAGKIFSQLGAFGFPVVAAMVAAMASLGFGGGGNITGPKPPTADEMQAALGTGTVLGDSGAKSESVSRALEIMASNTTKDLEFSNAAVRSLQAIERGISALTTQIARQLSLGGGGMFNTASLGLGQQGKTSVFGGTSTSRSLFDQGISFGSFSIEEAIIEGIQAETFSIVESIRKRGGFLGIGGGTTTTYERIAGPIAGQVQDQFALVFRDIGESVVQFIAQIALDTTGAMTEAEVRAAVQAVALPGANLSFVGMTGQQIEEALSAYFSSVADTLSGMTASIGTGLQLTEFQRAGEGLFETLARITRTISTVNATLGSVGLDRIETKNGNSAAGVTFPVMQSLVDQFGGLDQFQTALQSFGDKFLTEAERISPVIAAVAKEMERLGLAGVTTNDQFKATVKGLDLTSASGQETFAALMSVAPAFAKVNDYLGKLNGTAAETATSVADLAKIEQQRRTFDIQIMELQGNAEGALAARRQDAIAALDASLRPLQEQVYALQDQAEAAAAATRATAELAAEQTRIAAERTGLEARLLQLQGNTAELRKRELDALDPSNRALLEQIFALEDAASAANAATAAEQALSDGRLVSAQQAQAIAQEREGLETRLLQLQGDTVALREREMAALDPTNRALLTQIFALEDQKAAAEAAATATAALAAEQERIAQERLGLESRLLQTLGDTAALRSLELAALDPSNRAILARIFAIEDEKAATEAAAQATAAAAAEQERASAALLQEQTRVANERLGLEGRLLQALGNTADIRARELAALAPGNRDILHRIFALEDERKATEEAAAASRALVAEQERAAAETARIAQAVAAEAARVAGERTNLETRLLQLLGDSATLRERELTALDPSNREILRRIFAIEDEKAATVAATAELEKAEAERVRIAQEAAAEQLRIAEQLAAAQARIADERLGLENRILSLLGNTAEIRARELAVLDPSNRALLERIYAIEDENAAAALATQAAADLAEQQQRAAAEAQQAAEAIADALRAIADERSGLERKILAMTGQTAVIRQLELAALDASNRALLLRIFAIEDERAATEAATAAAEQAAAEQERATAALLAQQERVANERLGLEGRLLQLQGNTAELRRRELDALDPANRAILEQIFALEDLAKVTSGIVVATDELAIAREREALTLRLLEAQGDATGALAMRRDQELASVNESNREILSRIFALDDEARAANAAADASRNLAAEQARVANERYQLESRLLQAQGATSAIRERELAELDKANRSILEQIFALEDQRAAAEAAAEAAKQMQAAQEAATRAAADAARDAAAAQEAYARSIDEARGAISRALDSERSVIRERLSPLQTELSRLVEAITPARPDLIQALAVRDLLTDGLALAGRLSQAAKNVIGDNAAIIAAEREAARRELFRMIETRRIDETRVDELTAQATRFADFATAEAKLADQARTAGLLSQLATIQEENARTAQRTEDARAAGALQAVKDQISLLESQVAIQTLSLAALDRIAEAFGVTGGTGPTVADAISAYYAAGGGRIPGFADGGMHTGGLAMVGERGPELVNMGPSRVWNAGETASIMQAAAARDDAAIIAELKKQNDYLREVVKLSAKSERTLREIELQGEPA